MASLTAFSGMVMQGKEYIAPCTGLQLMPGTVLRTCSVSLAFSAKAFKVAVRSWMWQRKKYRYRKKVKPRGDVTRIRKRSQTIFEMPGIDLC